MVRPVLTGIRRENVAAGMRRSYEQGATIRDLMETYPYSYCTVRNLLLTAGTAMRKRGGDYTKMGRPQ